MDIKDQYEELTKKLKEVLPFSAFPIRELVRALRNTDHSITLTTELIVNNVYNVYNSGDISGIIYKRN